MSGACAAVCKGVAQLMAACGSLSDAKRFTNTSTSNASVERHQRADDGRQDNNFDDRFGLVEVEHLTGIPTLPPDRRVARNL